MAPSCLNFASFRNPRTFVVFLIGVLPNIVWAATAEPRESSLLGEALAIILPLVFIVGGLFAVLWLARKRFGITGKSAPLSILQILPVGPRERIVLVKTRAGRILAVGVAAHSLTLLAHLDAADVEDISAQPGDVA